MLKLSPSESLLCSIVADKSEHEKRKIAKELLSLLGAESAVAFADRNQVASHVAHALEDHPATAIPDSIWSLFHQETYNRLKGFLGELDRVSELLIGEGIPLVTLKNAGIARGIYPCPGCCPMGDLDVLVRKRDFRAAHQVLINEGYHFEFRSKFEEASIDYAEKSGGAEYWKILPNGEKLWFELQWRPIAGRWIRPDQEPSADELMERSIPIPGTDVRLLSPEDNLLQVSLHTAKHTYVRAPGFRLHTDVDRIVRRQKIDWNLFLSRVKSLQVKTAVYFSLAIPHAIFGTPIPEYVLEDLKPSRLKESVISRWIQSAGLLNPDEKKFSKPGYIVFNSLLYDDFRGWRRGVLPKSGWLKQRYGFESNLLVPFYHFRRLFDLALKRANT